MLKIVMPDVNWRISFWPLIWGVLRCFGSRSHYLKTETTKN
ncbi:hypothetical protein PROSTU_00402 [Providencia stuartii ATCC 25827]|uniref:Uncharacterized protein n=1 Tax=Providencia stuartii ATCC 25827 TaxID=471874 RepID=A0AA86YPB5_PROST|nr:hypothetical protein PROSTU_00402 [Providencia stuartii ATCC 25827]